MIKNLNTLANIQKAIDYEIKRQEILLLSGESILEETRRFDESKKKTVGMRIKTKTADYKYFTDANIPPIKLTREFINDVIAHCPELAEEKAARYKKLGLSDYDCKQLTLNKETCKYFEEIIAEGVNPKLAANWLLVEVQTLLNTKNVSLTELNLSAKKVGELITLIEKGIITNQQAREVLVEMVEQNINPLEIIERKGFSIISDEKMLLSYISGILKENPELITDYRNGKDRVAGFIVGKVMKLTQGKANPTLTNKLVKKELEEK